MHMRRMVVAIAFIFGIFHMPSNTYASTLNQYEVKQGVFFLTDHETIPNAQNPSWKKVELPHNWSDALSNQGGFGWYQLQQSGQVHKDKLWAVYLPLLNMNAAVYVNGQFIGSGGSFEEPMARHWNTPLYFLVPSAILQNRNNTISIRLKGYANAGTGLGSIYLGPDNILKPAYEHKLMQRHTFPMVSFFFSLMLCIISMFIWLLRRTEPMYAWFSLSVLMYSLFLANHFIQNIPVSRYLWEWALHSSTEWCIFFLLMFTHHFLKVKREFFEKIVLMTFLSISLLLLILPNDKNMFFYFNLTHVLSLLLTTYIVIMFAKKWLKKKHHTPFLAVMIILLCMIVFFAAHDLSMGLTPRLHNASFILFLSSPLLPTVLGWVLVYRFVLLQYQSDSFAKKLADEVIHTKQQLHQEFNDVRRLEKEKIIGDERERMMQDLHDELGGQLVSACALVNQNNNTDNDLKQMLNQALLDLRVVIDSLDNENRNLSMLLGMLRTRLEPQLRTHGITMLFKLHDGPELDRFEQDVALNLLRIVQEAITNAIRHAHCSEIMLYIQAKQGEVYLEVSDNGKGIENATIGRGMGNMRRRAKRIGAQLHISASNKGTTVQVIIAHIVK